MIIIIIIIYYECFDDDHHVRSTYGECASTKYDRNQRWIIEEKQIGTQTAHIIMKRREIQDALRMQSISTAHRNG